MSELLEKNNDFLRDLIETESQLTQHTLQLLRNRYSQEKEQWSKLHQNRDNEILSLRTKLSETEDRIRRVREDYSQEKLEEAEKLKLSIKTIYERKQSEMDKWKDIDEKVKTYRKLAEDLQVRLLDEQNKLSKMRERHIQEEQLLRETIVKYEEKTLSLRETLGRKEDEWAKTKAMLDQETSHLKQKLENFENIIKNEKDIHYRLMSEKEENSSKMASALQEVSVKFTQEMHNNEELKKQLDEKNNQVIKLELENKQTFDEVSRERAKWQENYQKEQQEWEKYKHELLEKEQILKVTTEEQIARVTAMLQILETQLDEERKTNENLKNVIAEKETQAGMFVQELDALQKITEEQKQTLDFQLKAQEENYEKQKQEILNQYGVYKTAKEIETARLNKEISELKVNVSEEARLFQLEKNENARLKAESAMLQEDKNKIIIQMEQDRNEWKKALIDEQFRSEARVKEINILLETVRKSRDEEIKNLNEEITALNGQFTELRVIYQGTKAENYQQNARVKELETEVQKILEHSDKERIEWQNMLHNAQKSWENQKVELMGRQNALLSERDREMKKIEKALDELAIKLINTEREVQKRDKEISELISKIRTQN